jgi:hypothetical protein
MLLYRLTAGRQAAWDRFAQAVLLHLLQTEMRQGAAPDDIRSALQEGTLAEGWTAPDGGCPWRAIDPRSTAGSDDLPNQTSRMRATRSRCWKLRTRPACSWMSDSRTCGTPGIEPRGGPERHYRT